MKILCGYYEYLNIKELSFLMGKMSDLSKYESIRFDSIALEPEERNVLEKAINDYMLFQSALIYLFSNTKSMYQNYYELISKVFNSELTYQQQSNFYNYYLQMRSVAIDNGFLYEYDLVLYQIKPNYLDIFDKIKIIFSIGFFIFNWYFFESFFIALIIYMIFEKLYVIQQQLNNDENIKLYSDSILSIVNKLKIESTKKYAEAEMINIGWLDKNGRVQYDDSK